MPTISELEQSLTDAANAGDMSGITSIVSSLTLEEKQQFDPSVFGYALTAVANYTNTDPALAASTAATFMQDVGLYTDSASISQGFATFGQFGNFAGVDAMVNNTDPQLYPSLDHFALGTTLFGISFAIFFDPAAAVATTANFLSHLSLYVDPFAITNVMQSFEFSGLLDGVNAVVNNIDPQVYPHLDPFMLGMALDGIAFSAFSDPAGAAATAANFLSHLGLYTDPGMISRTLADFAQNASFGGGFDGLNAVVDSIDPQIYPNLDSFTLGQALVQISAGAFNDPAGAIAATANFLSHLSLYTDPQSITNVLTPFMVDPATQLAMVNAVVDNIDPQIYASLDSHALGLALGGFVGDIFFDHDGTIATITNFISHLGTYTEPSQISIAINQLLMFGGADGAMAIIDNLAPSVYPSLDPSSLGSVLDTLAMSASYGDSAAAIAQVADFLSHVSLYTSTDSIVFSMRTFAETGLLEGVNTVIEHTDPQVYSHLDPTGLGFAMWMIANQTSTLDGHDVAATLGLFSEKLLPYADETWAEQAMQTVANAGNLSALGAVLDYTSSAQWDGLSSSFKDSLTGLGITAGTYLDDKYTGTSGTDKYFGLGGNDNIDGKAGDDILFGNAGDDKLTGGDGNDILAGGIGTDVLTGGAGLDAFVLGLGGVDKVVDFNKAVGGDKLDFRDIISNYDSSHPITDYVHVHTAGGNTIVSFDADGAGPGASVDIAKLQGVTGIDIQSLFDHGQILI
jgi:hypothetical protein